MILRLGWIPFLLAASLSAASAADDCKLVRSPPVPVKMVNMRPVISADIDGSDRQFIVDTGSRYDFLSPVAAAELKIPLANAPPWFQITGVGDSRFVPRMQAGANIDLGRALADCNRALANLPSSAHGAVLSNRSVVYLRLGQFDSTIADATASIQLRPQSPYPYYVRGLAELHKGLPAQGRADLAAAERLQPDIVRHYAVMGLSP